MTEEHLKPQSLSEGIERSHVLQAIAEFDRDGRPQGFCHSHTYVLVHDDRQYPAPPAQIPASGITAQGSYLR